MRFVQSVFFVIFCFVFFRQPTVFASPVPFDPVRLYGPEAVYQIRRDGNPVGKHILQFQWSGDLLRVDATMTLTIKLLWIPVYSYEYQSEAVWDGKGLKRITAQVIENGKANRVEGERKDGIFITPESSIEAPIYPTNHWNPAVLTRSHVFNTLTGRINKVKIERRGTETLTLAGQKLRATRYDYSGELRIQSWYDSLGRWVQMTFRAEDGSRITYQCLSCAEVTQ